jgi:hypothetical protein
MTKRENLYLCKMEPAADCAKFVAIIGRIAPVPGGYKFFPNTSAHQASRKVWPTANAAIPKWTEGYGFQQLLDLEELRAAQKAA